MTTETVRHPGLHPYPAELPAEWLSFLIRLFRGEVTDLKEGAHFLYHVLGYGLGKWDNHLIGAPGAPPLEIELIAAFMDNGTREYHLSQAMELVGSLVNSRPLAADPIDPSTIGMPWLQIVLFAIQLLQEMLRKQQRDYNRYWKQQAVGE